MVNGQPVYLYADPLVCRCAYFGAQQNWAAYRQEVFAKQLADEAQMTAIVNQEAWDWGPEAGLELALRPAAGLLSRRLNSLENGVATPLSSVPGKKQESA